MKAVEAVADMFRTAVFQGEPPAVAKWHAVVSAASARSSRRVPAPPRIAIQYATHPVSSMRPVPSLVVDGHNLLFRACFVL